MGVTTVTVRNNSGHVLDDRPAAVNRYTADDLPPCWNCRGPRERSRHANRDLCSRCYRRWQSHGFAGGAPPDAVPNRGEYVAAERIGWQLVARDPYLLLDFARLDNPSIPGRTAELCQRFGVTRRTLTRWRARLADERAHADRLKIAAAVMGRSRWRRRLRPGALSGREVTPDVGPVAALVAARAHDSRASSVVRAAYLRA